MPSKVLSYELAHMSVADLQRGASLAGKFWSQPWLRAFTGPVAASMGAAATLTHRSLTMTFRKPDWRIDSVSVNGETLPVTVRVAEALPFGDLVHFDKGAASAGQPRVLLVAPKSGHYATLLRDTVERLLPETDVYITDWRNARQVPVSAGGFDIEDYIEYLLGWFDLLGPKLHVIGVCQPAPLALVAAAVNESRHNRQPLASLTVMGGPIDPAANPTEVTRFADGISMEELEHKAIHQVGHAYEGRGRLVYPGALQLGAFISMNLDRHVKAFRDQWLNIAKEDEQKVARHNSFYDEYLAVMDMTAEFYLSTVERIFKNREVATGSFMLHGRLVSLSAMTKTPIMVVEGGRDDVAAPGQCAAALEVASGVPADMKLRHVEPDAGHYAIFSGSRWRTSVAPKILDFMKRFETAKAG